MKLEIPDEEYRKIEEWIGSDESPVGIDAKKTHVYIIYKLMELDRRLSKLESR